eukprot:COSAG01_NODE_8114_length_2915_cov_11.112216_3_plen_452_part_00
MAGATTPPRCSYFLTVSGGLETVALEEVRWRWPLLSEPAPSTTQGKVFFCTATPISVQPQPQPQPLPTIPHQPLLCTAERIFAQVLRQPPLAPPPTISLPAAADDEEEPAIREARAARDAAAAWAGEAVRSVEPAMWAHAVSLQRQLGTGGPGGAHDDDTRDGHSTSTGTTALTQQDRGANATWRPKAKRAWRPPDASTMRSGYAAVPPSPLQQAHQCDSADDSSGVRDDATRAEPKQTEEATEEEGVVRFRVCVKVGGATARTCYGGAREMSAALAASICEHLGGSAAGLERVGVGVGGVGVGGVGGGGGGGMCCCCLPRWVVADGDDMGALQVYVQCNAQHTLIGLAVGGRLPPLEDCVLPDWDLQLLCGPWSGGTQVLTRDKCWQAAGRRPLSERPDVPHPGLRATVAWAAALLALGPPPPLGAGRGGGAAAGPAPSPSRQRRRRRGG